MKRSARRFCAGLGLAAAVSSVSATAAPQTDGRVYQAVKANRQRAIDLLKAIVDIDSGTGDVEGGAKVEAIVIARLKALGAQVRSEPSEAAGLPDNVVATITGQGAGKILIIAHIDTVFAPGTAAARPFSIDGDRAHGPGVGDEKAGVVNAVMALTVLHELKFRRFGVITLLLDNSEERGSPGSTKLIKTLAAQNDVEFNMEPGDPPDAVTVWRKGSASLRLQVKGRAAHAGMAPQNGRNAAVELIHQLDGLKDKFPISGEGTTVNLTFLKAGERNNIIPDAAEATLNVRYRKTADFDAVLAAAEAGAKTPSIADTTVTVIHDAAFPPLIEDVKIDSVAKQAKGIYAELGRSLAFGGNGGASESALAQAVGTPALDGLGYVGGDFHTDHEWIDLRSVTPRLYLLTRLLMASWSGAAAKHHEP